MGFWTLYLGQELNRVRILWHKPFRLHLGFFESSVNPRRPRGVAHKMRTILTCVTHGRRHGECD